jgi:hypothetical protein
LRLKAFEFKRLEIHGRKIIGGRCGCAPKSGLARNFSAQRFAGSR